MLTVYGTTTCANCKAFLSMAKAKGHDPVYHLIDQDEAAKAAYENLAMGHRALPLVVRETDTSKIITQGLQAAISLLQFPKE